MPLLAQESRQLIGALVEFAIGQALSGVFDGACIWRALDLRFDEFMHTELAWILGLRRIPLCKLLLLFVRQQRKI